MTDETGKPDARFAAGVACVSHEVGLGRGPRCGSLRAAAAAGLAETENCGAVGAAVMYLAPAVDCWAPGVVAVLTGRSAGVVCWSRWSYRSSSATPVLSSGVPSSS